MEEQSGTVIARENVNALPPIVTLASGAVEQYGRRARVAASFSRPFEQSPGR